MCELGPVVAATVRDGLTRSVEVGRLWATLSPQAAMNDKDAPKSVMPVVLAIGTAELGRSTLLSKVGIELFPDLACYALPGIGTDQWSVLERRA